MDQQNVFTSSRLGLKIIGMFIILCLLAAWFASIKLGIDKQAENNGFSEGLLLDSGLATVEEAVVSIVIWLEAPGTETIVSLLPQAGWQWETVIYESASQYAMSIAGTKIITMEEESAIKDWYLKLAQEVAKSGGRAYFDERLTESIDIAAYLASVEAVPQQWTYLDRTWSIAGYQVRLGNPVQAGSDQINIQLLTRSSDLKGQTVLAIPVLLQEF